MPTSRRLLAKAFVDQLLRSGRAKHLSRSLAAHLIEQHRHKQAGLLIKDITLELAQRGHTVAEITTARPLTDQQRIHITQMAKEVANAETVELAEHIDPSVIGGLRLELPGQELDATVRRRLQALQF